jgi:hypothetical protein
MNRLTRALLVGAVVLLAGLGVAYATGLVGGRTCAVSGTITRDGKPLVWPTEMGDFVVLFVPEPRKENQIPYLAETDRATSSYRVAALPPGRYRVAIHQFVTENHRDALQNKYDPLKTPLEKEVTEDGQVIDIDLPKDLP